MQVQRNFSLKPYNTFGIDAKATYFAKISTKDELFELYDSSFPNTTSSPLIIGGGSNILLTQNYKGLVIKNEITGIEVVNEDEKNVFVRSAAEKTGTVLFYFVLKIISQG